VRLHSATPASGRRRPFWLLVFGGWALLVGASQGLPAETVRPDSVALLHRAQVLTSPVLAGRGSGTSAARACADTIVNWLQAAGLQPGFAGSWDQEFPLAGPELSGRNGCNVAGLLPGRGDLADRYLIVGAHYDHLGWVAADSAAAGPPAPGQYFPGANDNASGVTILLELARLAAPGAAPSLRSCLFVAFAAEEVGLQGSAYFAGHLPVPLAQIDAMLNFDCVGRLTDRSLFVGGVGTAEVFPELLQAANTDSLVLELNRSGWGGSDHVSFNNIEVPVLFFFTGAYPEYNRPADDWPTLNVTGLCQVTALADRLLSSLRAHPGPLLYLPVAGTGSPPPDGDTPPRRAWLGTFPDFGATEVEGVKLAGVIDGSPAKQAGLAKGDILVMLAGEPVADLASLTEILRDCRPGQQVTLQVLRGGKRLEYLVVLRDRDDR